ncbi:hypothetical protein ACEPAF_4954 [Sanghuangporus sanghuang]
MPTCTRNGCKKEFSEEENVEGACRYHPGGPVFHEGLKSWSCCQDVNKPVLDFDEFMKIEVRFLFCFKAASYIHWSEPQKTSAPATIRSSETTDGKETFTTTSLLSTLPSNKPKAPAPSPAEEEDDPSIPVVPGTICRRKGCGVKFISDEESRGDDAVCTYHPSPPIFHEGSKGYLCCKRRVLEFEEFLKIEGCKKGKHVFAPKKNTKAAEVQTTCRIDHYQTPANVCVSVFAKQADKSRSVIRFEENEVRLDIFLPDSKRFTRTLSLFGPIVPEESKYTFFGTKVELDLRKKDIRSWNLLERTDRELGGFNLTFGVGGRTGTIGSKAPVLDENNRVGAA